MNTQTIKTLSQVMNIKWETQQERDIMVGIVNHGITVHDHNKDYPETEKISLRKLLNLLNDEEIQSEMGFSLTDLHDFIIKYKIETVESFTPENIKQERTGKQIFRELEALENLIISHNLSFENITLEKATSINLKIKEILKQELQS